MMGCGSREGRTFRAGWLCGGGFPQRRANAHAAKPYGNSNYGRSLALFSELAQITDAAGHPVKLIRQTRIDEAAAALGQAIDIVEVNRGGGGLTLIFGAARELRPWQDFPAVPDTYDRLLTLMTAV